MTISMVGSKQSVNGGDGRRKSKASLELTQKKNRLPQRGMGMAQLERLRLQEMWNKMTQSSPSNTPVPFSTPRTTIVPNIAAQFRPPRVQLQSPTIAMLFQMHGSNQSSSDRVMDPSGFRFHNSRDQFSSIPSYITRASDECNVCYKKKRLNGGTYNENMPMNQLMYQLTDARSTRSSSGQVTDQVKSVMSVNPNGGSAVKEYEFFPRKGGGAAELGTKAWSGSGASVGGMMGLRGGEGSCVTAVGGSEEGSVSSLDLSLKLSY